MKSALIPTIPVLLTSSALLQGMATEQLGPDPAGNSPQPGWPTGIIEVLRHESRSYSRWVNGNEDFYFHANPEAVQELLNGFAKTRLRDHVVRITGKHDKVSSFKGEPIAYTVSLNILDGIALWHTRKAAEPKTHEPKLTIHVDADDASWLEKLKIPGNIILENSLAGSTLKGGVTRQERQTWHASIRFRDGSPAVDFEGGVQTRLHFWEEDDSIPMSLGAVDNKGRFHIALSEQEIREMIEGKSWITLLAGNYLDKPRSEHPRLSFENLSRDPSVVEPFMIDRPRYFHGRILFEDGTPVGNGNDLTWPGSRISVSFPYAGQPDIDDEGYFRLNFSDDQYDQLLKRRQRKNIYVPLEEKGRSRAIHTFPAEKLSSHKKTAGVVKIPRPSYFKQE